MRLQSLDSNVYPGVPLARAQRGAIVNIASGLGLAALPNLSAYCASKAGVIALTRSDALDYSAFRIRVNSVLPGAVQTPLTHGDDEVRQAIETTAVNMRTPLKRWGQMEEIADACASFIQGHALSVNGGCLTT